MLSDFGYRHDKLVDDCCYEEGLIVPVVDAARKKEASGEEIRLITQFGYSLLYC